MEQIYNVDFTRLIRWLIPPLQRNTFTVNWLKALISPVVWLYNQFILYKTNVDYRISITPQVCSLQKVLNDTFDNTLRRIQIADAPGRNILLIHTDEAAMPILLNMDETGNPTIIHTSSSYGSNTCDFIVIVPFSLTETQEYRMKSILDNNKLASKRYNIIYQ